MQTNLWACEKELRGRGYDRIAGVDEAGRGPLAGPVVAAAVILADSFDVPGVTDSKKLTALQRERLYPRIRKQAIAAAVGVVGPADIDRLNILQAALLAMAIAVGNLRPQPEFVLIDGSVRMATAIPQQTLVKGDGRSISIGAASIVAKVFRDGLMQAYHRQYPGYGFSRHKGYPTQAHRQSLLRLGACPIHRRSFRGVKELLSVPAARTCSCDPVRSAKVGDVD